MKILILFSFLTISKITLSQLWFDLGVIGGIGAGFLINKTISKDARLSSTPGLNNFMGGKIGINFGKYHSVTIDGTFANNQYAFLQTGFLQSKEVYRYSINYSAITIAPLYRKTSDAQYLEIGPEFSFYKKGEVIDQVNPTSLGPIEANNVINKNLTGLVFGFGGYIIGNETIALSMGLRAHYTFSNLTSPAYSSTNYPLVNYGDITTSSKTNTIAVQVLFELNYSLGQIAHASCGKRTAFIFF